MDAAVRAMPRPRAQRGPAASNLEIQFAGSYQLWPNPLAPRTCTLSFAYSNIARLPWKPDRKKRTNCTAPAKPPGEGCKRAGR
jgi:hypothetical protein